MLIEILKLFKSQHNFP